MVVIRDEHGVEIRARYDEIHGALVLAAIDREAAAVRTERHDAAPLDPDTPNGARPAGVEEQPRERLSQPEWRAEGLLRLAQTPPAEHPPGLHPSGFDTQVVLHLGLDTLIADDTPTAAALATGTGDAVAADREIPVLEPAGHPIRRDLARWLACDAGLLTVIEDDHGDALHLGRRHQTITPTLRRAVHSRYRTCTWPGCTATAVQLHHIHHRHALGHDDVENLVPECAHHHYLTHREHVTVTKEPDGTVHHWRNDGTEITANPHLGRPTPHALDAPDLLAARRHQLGADPLETARMPRWLGDTLDLDTAIGALILRHRLAQQRTQPTTPPGTDIDTGPPPNPN